MALVMIKPLSVFPIVLVVPHGCLSVRYLSAVCSCDVELVHWLFHIFKSQQTLVLQGLYDWPGVWPQDSSTGNCNNE